MLELLEKYSVQEILIFIVVLAVAIKGAVSYCEWAHKKLKDHFVKEDQPQKVENDLTKQINELATLMAENLEIFNKAIEEDREKQKQMQESIDLLLESDKDDIKSWITAQYHYFCNEKGYIDDFSLDCIEKRYKHYKDEGGNSFVADLMEKLRALPRVSLANVPLNNIQK